MDQPNFILGQLVILNNEKFNDSQFIHLKNKYGTGPFEILKVENLPENEKWPNEHPQMVTISTPKGPIKIRGKFLIPK